MTIDRVVPPPRGSRVLCAVSGGADSVCLLHLLKSREEAWDIRVFAAHFEHGLRGEESLRDLRFVERLCRSLDVPCVTERGDTRAFAAERRLGVEDAARRLRYAFLDRAAEQLGCGCIATAHTADDNAETLLLHLTRGCGLRGLGGIPPQRGRILRPLLQVTRSEIEDYLAAHGLPHVEDSTNESEAYSRNLLRRQVVPQLRRLNPALSEAMGRTAALLRRDEDCLSGLAEAWLRENGDGESLPLPAFNALHAALASRVLRLLCPQSLSAGHLEEALRFARGTERGVLELPGCRLRREMGRLTVGDGETDPPVFPARPVRPGETTDFPELGLRVRAVWGSCPAADEKIHSQFKTYSLKCEKLNGDILAAPARGGDRLRPVGRGVSKSLKALFLEAKMTRAERARTLVFRDGGGILAAHPFGTDERCAAAPGERALLLQLEHFEQKTGETDEE